MKVTPIPKTPRVKDKNCMDKIRTIGHCEVCGSSYLLQVHHIKSRGAGGDDEDDNMICLCFVCHRKAHDGNISKESFIVLRSKCPVEILLIYKCMPQFPNHIYLELILQIKGM